MKKAILMVSVAVLLLAGQTFATVTWSSTTWEGSYEGNAKPGTDGWTCGNPGYCSPKCHPGDPMAPSGVLWVSSVNCNCSPYWSRTTPPTWDMTTGVTLEFRLKLLQSENSANFATCMFAIQVPTGDGTATKNFSWGITDTQWRAATPGASTRTVAFDPTDDFHIYRVKYSDASFNIYVDHVGITGGGVSSDVSGNPGSLFQFGDFTGTDDSEYLLDYVRWTGAGAFPIPEPATMLLLGIGGVLGVIRKRR